MRGSGSVGLSPRLDTRGRPGPRWLPGVADHIWKLDEIAGLLLWHAESDDVAVARKGRGAPGGIRLRRSGHRGRVAASRPRWPRPGVGRHGSVAHRLEARDRSGPAWSWP